MRSKKSAKKKTLKHFKKISRDKNIMLSHHIKSYVKDIIAHLEMAIDENNQ